MKPDKKPSLERKSKLEAVAPKFGLLSVIVAMAIMAAVPVALNPPDVLTDPAEAVEVYTPFKLEVLVWSSAALLAALGFAVQDRGPLRVPVLIPALAFLGVSALSTLLSEDPAHSLYGDRNDGLLSLAAGVLLFYAVAKCLNSPFRVRIFLAAGVAAAVLVSILGISQKYGFDPITGWVLDWYTEISNGPFSTIGNPIFLAAYLTLMIGAATALCFKAGSLVGRVPWLLALAVMGACWIYTDSRGTLLGVGVTLPVVLWLAHRKMGTTLPLLAPLGTLVGAMALAIAASAAFGNLTLSARILAVLAAYVILVGTVLLLSHYRPRAVLPVLIVLGVLAAAMIAVVASGTLGSMSNVTRGTGDESGIDSVEVRLYAWRDTVPMILDRPLLGHGPANFRAPFESYTSEELKAASTSRDLGGYQVYQRLDKPHNDLLQVAATTGLLGLAAYLWVLVSYFRGAYRRGGWPMIALSGGVLAYILQLQTSFPDLNTNVAFWGLLGASAAVMRLHDLKQQGEDPETPGAGSVERALTPVMPKARAYELMVVAVVVGVVAVIAVPTFLNQREKAAETKREMLMVDVEKFVLAYNLASVKGEPYPEAGVYTKENPLEEDDITVIPTDTVTITTTVTPPNSFTVEGESTSLSGTFWYSYSFDGATGEYSAPP